MEDRNWQNRNWQTRNPKKQRPDSTGRRIFCPGFFVLPQGPTKKPRSLWSRLLLLASPALASMPRGRISPGFRAIAQEQIDRVAGASLEWQMPPASRQIPRSLGRNWLRPQPRAGARNRQRMPTATQIDGQIEASRRQRQRLAAAPVIRQRLRARQLLRQNPEPQRNGTGCHPTRGWQASEARKGGAAATSASAVLPGENRDHLFFQGCGERLAHSVPAQYPSNALGSGRNGRPQGGR